MSEFDPSDPLLEQEFQKLVQREDLVEYMRDQVNDFNELMAYYTCAMMEVETKFKVLSEGFSYQYERNPIESIKSRLKSVRSIRNKLERRGFDFSVSNIEQELHDVAGVRVICSFIDDVYMLACALEQQDDITVLERKDYIEHPKENGYRSLHLIVSVPIFLTNEKRVMHVEVQLRTIAMDFWATIEHHLRYKKNFHFTQEMADELQECADVSAQLDKRMNKLRTDILEQPNLCM